MVTSAETAAAGGSRPAIATARPDSENRPRPAEIGELGEGEPAPPTRKPWWVYALRIAALLVVAAVIVTVLSDDLPSPAAVWRALKTARWWWVVAALLLQFASIAMLIRQQRRLLRAFGVPLKLRRVGAITYSSTALSMSMPAGGAVGAGYSYRQYRANGASSGTAATVLLLSGILSVVGLVLLYLAGLGLAVSSRLLRLGDTRPLLAVLIGVGVAGAIIVASTLLSMRRPRDLSEDAPPTPRLDRWSVRHPRLGPAVRQVLSSTRQASRVPGKDWKLALLTSAGNWALDAACLYASCLAFGITISPWELGAIYLGIQLVRQIPITPGGVGVIEASLLAALATAHVAVGPASAAVLVYRLFSAWLIVPIGFVLLAILRRRTPSIADADATGEDSDQPAAEPADQRLVGGEDEPAGFRPHAVTPE